MTMKAHTYYIIFGHPPIGGKLPPFPPVGATVQHWGAGHHTPFLGAQSKVVFPKDRWHNIKEKTGTQ